MTRARWTAAAVAVAVIGGLGLELDASLGADEADRVTLQARPIVVTSGIRVTLFGSVDNGRAGEDIKIQAKDCGRDFFRVVAGAITKEGGEWSTFYFGATINQALRAVWRDATSQEVPIRRRASVSLRERSGARFEVRVYGRPVWRKRVFVQRFDRRLGTWQAVKTVVLTEDEGSTALAAFTVRLSKGTRIRAVFPRSQSGPCFLAGTSNTLTT
jgi:hypothetical protein